MTMIPLPEHLGHLIMFLLNLVTYFLIENEIRREAYHLKGRLGTMVKKGRENLC